MYGSYEFRSSYVSSDDDDPHGLTAENIERASDKAMGLDSADRSAVNSRRSGTETLLVHQDVSKGGFEDRVAAFFIIFRLSGIHGRARLRIFPRGNDGLAAPARPFRLGGSAQSLPSSSSSYEASLSWSARPRFETWARFTICLWPLALSDGVELTYRPVRGSIPCFRRCRRRLLRTENWRRHVRTVHSYATNDTIPSVCEAAIFF